MKKILLFILMGMFLFPGYSQISRKAVVYLKSGAVIKGKLLINDNERVKINSAGNEWVFKAAEVDSVIANVKTKRESDLTQNYFFDTSMGVLLGNSGNNQSAPFSFTSSLNYRIFDKLFVGAGLGTEFFDESYMPVFGQLQYKFRETRFTPFFNLQAGYEIALEDGNRQHYSDLYYSSSSVYYNYYQNPNNSDKLNAEGGFMINPSVGFQRFTSDNFGWFFAFGYRYHQLNYTGDKEYKLETNFSRLSLKIGFIFN
jgi:hypothetical protein